MNQTESLSADSSTDSKSIDSEAVMRIMSFNICWEKEDQQCPSCKWQVRKNRIASVIRFHRADIVGLQEPFRCQLQDLRALLPDYEQFGVGLDDGCESGLHDAILFRKSRYQALTSDIFFLSPTPDLPSRGWDAKYPRGATWMKMLDRKTGKSFFFFNTHFDYHSRLARDESAFLLREKVSDIAGNDPFIVVGDFNLFPQLGGGETYQLLTDPSDAIPGKPFVDAQVSTLFPHHGPTGTWSGFKEAGQPGVKPDYIFVERQVLVYSHGVLADSFDGHFPSDHLPVVADVGIP